MSGQVRLTVYEIVIEIKEKRIKEENEAAIKIPLV